MLHTRAAATLGSQERGLSSFADLPPGTGTGLAAAVGISGGEALMVDLVHDGPHAVVVGMTGSGKSELLTTWVATLCRDRSPREVTFLLVDFKGGRTFDALTRLPHVTGVLTDLDEAKAVRAVESLRAEITHRERMLAELAARDVSEAAGTLPRLVIVVDEYAALVATHPGLHEVFGDLAARGRALGMHLILASQRVAGSFRDAVLANAPLRVALRVTDAGESRAVLGTPAAAALSGAADARGLALVRRASDDAPVLVRVIPCPREALVTIAARAEAQAAGVVVRAPWLPALPASIRLESARRAGEIVLGVMDEPAAQRQPVLTLEAGVAGFVVVGGSGSGKTEVLRSVAAQAARCAWLPADAEAAWDFGVALESQPPGTVICLDDVDAVLARMPGEYAAVWGEWVERTAREARSRGVCVIASTGRLSGSLARVAETLPRRLLLPLPSRGDHVAAGGESADFVADAAPGRGRWGRTLVQCVRSDALAPDRDIAADVRVWRPVRRPAAFIAPAGPRTRALLTEWVRMGVRVVGVDEPGAALAPGVVLYGSPEVWLAQWRMLSAAKAESDLVIDAACAAEYRALTGRRELPPLVHAGARRAWLLRGDAAAARVRLDADR